MRISSSSLLVIAATLASLLACDTPKPAAATAGADTVLLGGRVYTVDAARSWAEAVAIRDGRITYVGTNAGVDAYIGADTSVVDLGGRMLLPAFQDSHIHPISGGIEAAACDLNGLQDLAEYRAAISAYAAENPDVPWILGGGWLMSVFGPGGAPSRLIIDELVPDRPVYLTSSDGHSGWANSKALEIAGITRDTPDPSGGIIDRDPQSGELIGSLQEHAMDLVARHIPATSLESRLAGLKYAQDMLHEYGITSIQDANVVADDLEAYATLDKLGELKLRVVASLLWDRARGLEQLQDLQRLRQEYSGSEYLRPTTVKIYQDGVMENYTAAMLEPYLVPGGTRGIPMIEPEFLKQVVTALDAADFQVHFHAIGDAAVRQSLDAIEAAIRANGRRGNRHHIAHVQMLDPADIPRFAELDAVANFQPLWAYADEYVTELTIPFIGPERARWMYAIRSVADSGGRIAFGSDWSVSSANPFPQIETAVTRQDADDASSVVFIPEERIDLAAAIAAFTIGAAYVNTQDDKTGSIEPGKFADLIVVDRNLFDIDPHEISDARVLLTLLAGEPVYGDPSSL